MPNAPAGLLYPGDTGVPAGLIPTFKKGFAPRVGVAWDPTGSAKWLVTSAYGIFYEPYYTGQGGPLQSPISAPPYLQTEQISCPAIFPIPSTATLRRRHICHAADQPDSCSEPAPALLAGLGPEHPKVLRRQISVRGRLRGNQGNQAAALHRRQPRDLHPRRRPAPASHLHLGQR